MKRILLQAGHQGRTSGATGAPGEQAFTVDVCDKVANKLREVGMEARRIPADPVAVDIAGDWDLFLSVHYDADVYNAPGGFIDYPEPSTDGATAESQRIAKVLTESYFPATGIQNMPNRSNKNTRYYYMWSKVSAKTPCVIIECGVGNRKPDDYETLTNRRDTVINAIFTGICKAFGINTNQNTYKGIDLTNTESVKVCVDTWAQVVAGEYVKKTECQAKLDAVTQQRDEAEGTLKAMNDFKTGLAQMFNCENKIEIITGTAKTILGASFKVEEIQQQLEKEQAARQAETVENKQKIDDLVKQLDAVGGEYQTQLEKVKTNYETEMKTLKTAMEDLQKRYDEIIKQNKTQVKQTKLLDRIKKLLGI